MSDLKANLSISADTSGVDSKLAGLKASVRDVGVTAQQAGAKASEGLQQIGEGGDAAAQKLDRTSRQIINSIQRTTAAAEAGQRGTAKYFEALANQKGVDPAVLKPYLASLESAQAAQAKLNTTQVASAAAATTQTASLGKLAAGQKLTAYQTQQLSFQLNDFFVQIASGQSPLTALIQQGSQLNGTFGGIGGSLRAIGSLFSVARVAVGGLAVVLGGFAIAAYKGAQESDALNKAIALTGDYAGKTAGQVGQLAEGVAASSNSTIGSAREVVAALVSSGRFTAQTLGDASTSVLGIAKATGESTEKVTASFIALAGNVSKGAEDLNTRYHFLTGTQLDYIKTLDDQGRSQQALDIVLTQLNNRLKESTQNLGYLASAWDWAKKKASEYADAALNVGRTLTPEESLKNLRQTLDARLQRGALNPTTQAAFDKGNAALREQIDSTQETVRLGQRAARLASEKAQQEEAATKFIKAGDEFLSKTQKKEKEIANARAQAAAGGVSDADLKKRIADISKKYEDTTGENKALAARKAQAALEVESVKEAGQQLVVAYSDSEKILEARRAANLVDDKSYFEAKKGFAQLNLDAQIDALDKENDILRKQKLTGADAINRNKEIAKNEAEIAKLRQQSATQIEIVSIQQEAAAERIRKALKEAQQAEEDYLQTQANRFQRDLDGAGQGNRQRDRDALRNQTDDEFLRQRNALRDRKSRDNLPQEQYDAELAVIEAAHKKALQLDQDYFDKKVALEQNWRAGAREALTNYFNDTQNVFQQTQDVVNNAFKGMEDVLVDFVRTGKFNFKSLADSIISDLLRIEIRSQITGPLAKWLNGVVDSGGGGNDGASGFSFVSSLFSMFSSFGGRASGGPVSAGGMYRVNENGPELLNVAGRQYLMMGTQGGSVTPNAGGGPGTVIFQNQFGDISTPRSTQRQIEATQRRGAMQMRRSQEYS